MFFHVGFVLSMALTHSADRRPSASGADVTVQDLKVGGRKSTAGGRHLRPEVGVVCALLAA